MNTKLQRLVRRDTIAVNKPKWERRPVLTKKRRFKLARVLWKPSPNFVWILKSKKTGKIKKIVADTYGCADCRNRKRPKACVRLVRKFAPTMFMFAGTKNCFAPKKCPSCERNLKPMDAISARNHYHFCATEELGIWDDKVKAYAVAHFIGRAKYGELMRAKKLFKKDGKLYRRV